MDLKKLRPAALMTIAGLFAVVFIFAFFADSKYSYFEPLIIVGGLIFLYFLIRGRKKTKIEKFYDAVIKNMTSNDKGIVCDGVSALRLKALKKLSEEKTTDGIVYTFKMDAGMSRSKYEQYKEALEQYLDSEVKFSFNHNLKIEVTGTPTDRYK